MEPKFQEGEKLTEKVTYDAEPTVPTVSGKDRLVILRRVLYFGGCIYIGLVTLIIFLQVLGKTPESTELTILITMLGTTLTTIIGVIIGSSLDNN